MRLSRRWQLSPSNLLSIALLSTLLLCRVSAQGLPQISTTDPANLPSATQGASAAPSDVSSNGGSSQSDSNSGSSAAATNSPSDLPNLSSAAASTSGSAAASSTDGSGPPKLTSSAGLPSLPGGFSYPAPSVPPTANAPFMQKSSVPEGTIFIAVGAVLGFVALVVLAWRALVAWSVNRSVKRAALQSYSADAKSLLGPRRKSAMYSQTRGSSISLEKLGPNHHRSVTATSKGHTPNASLFFSPTAGAGMHTPMNRQSGYMPAGYYAAGNATPGGGSGMTHIGGNTPSLRPHSQTYTRRKSEPTPPGSPDLPPSRGQDARPNRLSNPGTSTYGPSTSSLNLSTQPQVRTPSAYLEDLFESHPPGTRDAY